MPKTATEKNYAKLIDAYYATLKDFAHQRALHEGAVSVAFQTLLGEAGRSHKWTLVPQLSDKQQGKSIRPDGTFKDFMNLVRGHWEAKDTSDDLDVEIQKKIKKGYPLGNIIFEDTRSAVLYQDKQEVMRIDLKNPEQVANLLRVFFEYIEPQIESFEKAIGEFKERVPELSVALKEKVTEAHASNKKFKEAFGRFFELCQTSLNPNISKEAVDDMLVQHLLTERLIREIFDNPEFTRRNVIAVEIEKVIEALTSKSFNRDTFLRSLDRFYVAIEAAARTITEWSDKQHFLNTVYERFFQGYSVKLADTMGIVYTPQEIVDFMCASVEEVLKTEFGKTLASDDVYIIDPCTGTGNFIVNLIRRIPKAKLEEVYKHRLFANEIMLLPYYIAALNIEHAFFEQAGKYEIFEGLCFADTLDLAEHAQGELGFMTAANSARVARQRKVPITVVIGNPPYNVGQSIHNDKNQNRAYPVLDQRVRETYAADSNATSVSKLSDAYVKFFRWASDRLNGRDGIVCYVTNNGFVDQLAFDGMRKNLMENFSTVYHLDLEGNVRHDPKLSGTAYNVFGIQVGVGITIAVRNRMRRSKLRYAHVDKFMRREDKLAWLAKAGGVSGVKWKSMIPDLKHTWLIPANGVEFTTFTRLAGKEDRAVRNGEVQVIFKDYSLGIATHRDAVVYDFNKAELAKRAEKFADDYNAEVDRFKRTYKGGSVDEFVRYERIAWDRDLKADLRRGRYVTFDVGNIRTALYRPFCRQALYFDRILNAEVYGWPSLYPTTKAERENHVIACSDIGFRAPQFSTLITAGPADLHLCATLDGHQCFPFYVYDEDGSNRRENITDWALKQFREQYKDKKIDKWAIFYYVYGVLHHPGYREKFADNLKRELPRIPFAPDFHAFAKAGKELAELHLDYEKLEPWKLKWIETPGEPLSYRVEKMKLVGKAKAEAVEREAPPGSSPDAPENGEGTSTAKTARREPRPAHSQISIIVNQSLTLGGIPAEVLEYRLGNRSALEWVIDQYQVSTDQRSGILSDPNREDDPEYIVKLVGQVVRVSVETVKIVNALPAEFTDAK